MQYIHTYIFLNITIIIEDKIIHNNSKGLGKWKCILLYWSAFLKNNFKFGEEKGNSIISNCIKKGREETYALSSFLGN